MKLDKIIEKLEEMAPASYAESWDNCGLLVGRREKEVRCIYIALDATRDVIDQALAEEADLILTHHPMIFKGIKRVSSDDFVGKRVLKLARQDMCLYSIHTNFDVMGMADAAADVLGLRQREVLSLTFEDEIAKEGFGRFGRLPRVMSLDECADYVKDQFHLESVRVYGDGELEIERAAILPGSGSSMISDALDKGAEVMITGDISHHDGIDAWEQGLAVIDAGHYGLEQIFIPYMEEFLKREFPQIRVVTDAPRCPFHMV
ncbi:MAG: Nif3-like dinuclear metal center hexameric protein [Lachnospiraceae bacterium]|nr:Nif3-like dinuclear metal center hexameric protein [Lachnospiraceae bacterium]